MKVQVSSMQLNNRLNRVKVLKNKVEYIEEYNANIKSVFFVEQETLCDSAVMDSFFNIHVVNGSE